MFYLLHIIIVSCFTHNVNVLAEFIEHHAKLERDGEELLLCRKCGADVADSFYLFSKQSPGAQKIEKQNIFGRHNVTVQTLVNPFGVKFEVVTAEKARCDNIGPNQGADSWFPGYTWRICACPYCGQHLGWTFEKTIHSSNEKPAKDTFHGLILTNVLGENFTDSLIMMPKMYKM
ncbi:hypothetical protein K1T71_003398 [Dendrolimus kikuchii]|uniref:Uncharacterized protein n=1 Tax=Dendrolimus kikuchii TaxID=765133 RepID=A0ACC1DBI2_9NEOP|nr:hypothetical protein K1T71_003398 [Dendrolimus kikuchii]